MVLLALTTSVPNQLEASENLAHRKETKQFRAHNSKTNELWVTSGAHAAEGVAG